MCDNNDCIPKIYIFHNPELPGLILMYLSRSIRIFSRCALSLAAGRMAINTEAITLENCYGNGSNDQRKNALFFFLVSSITANCKSGELPLQYFEERICECGIE
jgi:hypothetical protein